MSEVRVSSFCHHGGCVGVNYTVGSERPVRVMDTNEPERRLAFTREEWEAFIAGVKNGEFDLPEWVRV